MQELCLCGRPFHTAFLQKIKNPNHIVEVFLYGFSAIFCAILYLSYVFRCLQGCIIQVVCLVFIKHAAPFYFCCRHTYLAVFFAGCNALAQKAQAPG